MKSSLLRQVYRRQGQNYDPISLYIYTGNMIRANDTIAFRSTARLYCEEFAAKTGVQEARSEL